MPIMDPKKHIGHDGYPNCCELSVRRVIHTIDHRRVGDADHDGGTITLDPGQIPIGRDGATVSKDDAISAASVLRRIASDYGEGSGTERLLRVAEALISAARVA